MLEIFNKWFDKFDISVEQRQKYIMDLEAIVAATIVNKAQECLATDDNQQLENLIKQKKIELVLPFIEQKYSPADWEKFLDAHIPPLLDSYLKEVIQAS